MNQIRRNIGKEYDEADAEGTAGYVIIYLALVILTGVFTVQYLKRVIYMAFLTMIAPMIALTYPLDRIKDGKAQAFNFWLKEYIFNCLIQPVHLLLYTILITNVLELATNNMLYAVVALGFLVPAEKLIKQMFGMKSQSPVGTLGAAAGGAMIMNMLGKAKKKGPKAAGGKQSSSSPKGVRTPTTTPSVPQTFSSGETITIQNSGSEVEGGNGNGSSLRNSGSSSAPSSSSAPISTDSNSTSIANGIKNAARGLRVRGVDSIKSAGMGVLKSAPGAMLGATIGLAATVASGGNKAITSITGGLAAGSALSSNLVGKIENAGNEIYEDYQKGKYGEEAYNNKKFDNKFFKSEGYKLIEEDSDLLATYGGKEGIKVVTQEFLDNGITDADKIRTALQKGVTGEEYKEYTDAGITDIKEIVKAKKWTMENKNGERRPVSASYYANLKKIAKYAKGKKDKNEFVGFAQNIRIEGKEIGTEAAEEIYKNIVDLL